MTFKGNDLNCTVKELSNKLAHQGYEVESGLISDMYMLKGIFAGESAEIAVWGDSKTHMVSGIIVSFEQEYSWESLEKKYLTFKESLNKKYGAGESTEIFKEPYGKGDGKEMEAVSTGNCNYATKYKKFDNGSIVLDISKDGSVKIIYFVDTRKNQEQQRNNDL